MKNNFEQKIESILTVAQILAENGATTDRIIRNSKRIATFFNIPEENFHLQVMPSILFLNVFDGEKSHQFSRICKKNDVDMNIVTAISRFTHEILEKNYSLEEFQQNLEKIINPQPIYSHWQKILAAGTACGGLCVLFGGDFLAAIYTAICAIVGKFLQIKLSRFGINEFLVIFCAAFTATFLAYFAKFLPTETIWRPIIACSLFLVPGVPIINSIIDSLNNFLLNGMTKAFKAILIVVGMTFGIILAIYISDEFSVSDFTNLTTSTEHNFLVIALSAAVAAGSFSILLNVSKKFLSIVAILSAVGVSAKFFLMSELNCSPEIATIVGTTLISLIMIKFKNLILSPMQTLVIPAIIPFIPGVMIYRFLFACITIEYLEMGEFYSALYTGIDALQVIFFMTIGATLPNLISEKLWLKK